MTLIKEALGSMQDFEELTLGEVVSAGNNPELESVSLRKHPHVSLGELVSYIDKVGDEVLTPVEDRKKLLAAYLVYDTTDVSIISKLSGIPVYRVAETRDYVYRDPYLSIELVMVHSQLPPPLSASE